VEAVSTCLFTCVKLEGAGEQGPRSLLAVQRFLCSIYSGLLLSNMIEAVALVIEVMTAALVTVSDT
jgi:hypothetical protein